MIGASHLEGGLVSWRRHENTPAWVPVAAPCHPAPVANRDSVGANTECLTLYTILVNGADDLLESMT